MPRLIAILATAALGAGIAVLPAGTAGASSQAHHGKRHHRHHRRHGRQWRRHHHVRVRDQHAVGAPGQPAGPAAGPGGCVGADVVPTPDTLDQATAATACLVNHERDKHGLGKLREDPDLAAAARAHSRDMVDRDYFDHTSPTGVSMVDRLLRSGYVDPSASWALGENIAVGSGLESTPAATVDAWMHSPGHRANILNPNFRDSGMGVAIGVPRSAGIGSSGASYTQDFGARG